MKINYRRIAEGRESARHYEGRFFTKSGRRDERRSDGGRREIRELLPTR